MAIEPVAWPVRTFLQLTGKVRRFVLHKIRPSKVKEKLAHRSGECSRCGACCRLLFKCPFLGFDADGLATCKIYHKRPANCRIFPMDTHDIRERNLVPSISLPCGYKIGGPNRKTTPTIRGGVAD